MAQHGGLDPGHVPAGLRLLQRLQHHHLGVQRRDPGGQPLRRREQRGVAVQPRLHAARLLGEVAAVAASVRQRQVRARQPQLRGAVRREAVLVGRQLRLGVLGALEEAQQDLDLRGVGVVLVVLAEEAEGAVFDGPVALLDEGAGGGVCALQEDRPQLLGKLCLGGGGPRGGVGGGEERCKVEWFRSR